MGVGIGAGGRGQSCNQTAACCRLRCATLPEPASWHNSTGCCNCPYCIACRNTTHTIVFINHVSTPKWSQGRFAGVVHRLHSIQRRRNCRGRSNHYLMTCNSTLSAFPGDSPTHRPHASTSDDIIRGAVTRDDTQGDDDDEAGSLGDFIENDEGGDYVTGGGARIRASPHQSYGPVGARPQEPIQPGATPAGRPADTERGLRTPASSDRSPEQQASSFLH